MGRARTRRSVLTHTVKTRFIMKFKLSATTHKFTLRNNTLHTEIRRRYSVTLTLVGVHLHLNLFTLW